MYVANCSSTNLRVFFVVRKKNILYTLIMTGFYTNDHSLVTSLIEPDIKNLEDFKIIEY